MSLLSAPPVEIGPPVPLDSLLAIGLGLASTPASLPVPLEPEGRSRTYVRLLATDAYEAWLLAWPPGSEIPAHDHGDSHGAFVVVSGTLVEARHEASAPHRRVLGPGDAATVPVGLVHEVSARGEGPALSVHVYSPPLSEMRFYDAGGEVVAVEEVAQEEPGQRLPEG